MEKIILLSAGKGPKECASVVAKVLKFLLAEAKVLGIISTILHREKGSENGTLLSATLQLEGKNLANFVKSWRGTIKWIGKSEFRKHHKRKNWFIGVHELDLSDEKFSFQDKDFTFKATRASGPGGQHVNKVSTAVRAVHLPTGLAILASDSRSQSRNKKNAKERLINVLKVRRFQEKQAKVKNSWLNHHQLERGNPVRVIKGSDFKSEFVVKKYKRERFVFKTIE